MRLGESLEDYLETLLILEKTGKIRCVDVASKLKVSKPSVNKAMNVLKEKGYVHQESYGDIHLSDEGRKIAQEVYHRHQVISSFLTVFPSIYALLRYPYSLFSCFIAIAFQIFLVLSFLLSYSPQSPLQKGL